MAPDSSFSYFQLLSVVTKKIASPFVNKQRGRPARSPRQNIKLGEALTIMGCIFTFSSNPRIFLVFWFDDGGFEGFSLLLLFFDFN
jgi:hypothetical protein